MKTNHPVTFVSLGPGEAELITVKGLKALQAADVIFCPGTPMPDGKTVSRAACILQQLGLEAGAIRCFSLPMHRQRTQALAAYHRVCEQAIALQRVGKRVCVVAEGDAGFYASIHYVYDMLQSRDIPVTHVPGIPAFIAAGALAGLHLAGRDKRLVVIPGTATAEEIAQTLEAHGTVVIMKLSQCTDEVHRCMERHPEYSYHYFENVGTDREVYLHDIRQISSLRFPYFSLLIVKNGKE